MSHMGVDEVVRAFYAALNGRDVAGLNALVSNHFADDVVVAFPPSLPYGGQLRGAPVVGKVFAGLATSKANVGPKEVAVRAVLADRDRAVALLDFDWFPPGGGDAVSSGACESWRFEHGRVVEIRAYYWDTAALVAAS